MCLGLSPLRVPDLAALQPFEGEKKNNLVNYIGVFKVMRRMWRFFRAHSCLDAGPNHYFSRGRREMLLSLVHVEGWQGPRWTCLHVSNRAFARSMQRQVSGRPQTLNDSSAISANSNNTVAKNADNDLANVSSAKRTSSTRS
jgi:hypothetical protein